MSGCRHSLKVASRALENIVGYDRAVRIFQVERAARHVVDDVRAVQRNDRTVRQARENHEKTTRANEEHYERSTSRGMSVCYTRKCCLDHTTLSGDEKDRAWFSIYARQNDSNYPLTAPVLYTLYPIATLPVPNKSCPAAILNTGIYMPYSIATLQGTVHTLPNSYVPCVHYTYLTFTLPYRYCTYPNLPLPYQYYAHLPYPTATLPVLFIPYPTATLRVLYIPYPTATLYQYYAFCTIPYRYPTGTIHTLPLFAALLVPHIPTLSLPHRYDYQYYASRTLPCRSTLPVLYIPTLRYSLPFRYHTYPTLP